MARELRAHPEAVPGLLSNQRISRVQSCPSQWHLGYGIPSTPKTNLHELLGASTRHDVIGLGCILQLSPSLEALAEPARLRSQSVVFFFPALGLEVFSSACQPASGHSDFRLPLVPGFLVLRLQTVHSRSCLHACFPKNRSYLFIFAPQGRYCFYTWSPRAVSICTGSPGADAKLEGPHGTWLDPAILPRPIILSSYLYTRSPRIRSSNSETLTISPPKA